MNAAVAWVRRNAPVPSLEHLIVGAILSSVLVVGLSAAALVLGWQERDSARAQVRVDEIAACRSAFSAELITGPIAFGLRALATHGQDSPEFKAATELVNPERFVELAELSRTDTDQFLALCHQRPPGG